MRQLQRRLPVSGEDREDTMSVARAEAERSRLQGEIERLQSQLTALQHRIVKVEHYIEMVREYESVASPLGGNSPDSAESSRTRAPKGGVGGSAARHAVAIIRERGRPIPTRDLVELLKERGVNLGGNNQITTLSSYLSRTPELKADRSQGWSLKEWTASASEAHP
jgi:hypothetical protein